MSLSRSQHLAKPVCSLLALTLAAVPVQGLQFFLDVSSYSQGAEPVGYGVGVSLDAAPDDFDDLVDGYQLTSPDGSLTLVVSMESTHGAFGLLFTSFDQAASSMFGTWTISETVFGTPLGEYPFEVTSDGFSEADLPSAALLFPALDATGISVTPTLRFTGPAEANQIGVSLRPEVGSYPDEGFVQLPGSAVEYTPTFNLLPGLNQVSIAYNLAGAAAQKVFIGTPAGLRWQPNFSSAAVANSQFVVSESQTELRLSGPERKEGLLEWNFPTESQARYDVEQKDDVNSPTWQLLQTLIGTGGTMTFSVSPEQRARFFRVTKR
ncbi:MAG: hypothetical protein JNN07_07835 [Verrucomicrobiales bacterium]|nr:hypothetical protein [Verrucomicrobiales bacterium]